MNRNNERHFNQIPEMKASRTRFNRDQTILTTFDSGKLIPFYVDEVLPGDTFNVNTAAIVRMSTPKYPVMDDAFIDFYYFYCPNRILWDNFKQFMGEVEETPWMPKKNGGVPPVCPDERLRYVTAACGDCYECRKQKQRQWVVRMSEENRQTPNAYFLTLTIDDKSYSELSNTYKLS